MIYKYKPESEYYTSEKCYINELCNTDEDPECSIAHARVKPGVTTELHALSGTVERYVILSGQGEVEVDAGEPTLVGPLDVVVIAAGVSQCITNTGKEDLIFLAVCTPRFKPEVYCKLASTA